MRLVSFLTPSGPAYGAVVADAEVTASDPSTVASGSKVVNLAPHFPDLPDLRQALRENRLDELSQAAPTSNSRLRSLRA